MRPTTDRPTDAPTEPIDYAPDDPDGEVRAYQPTPTGAIIRVRGYETADGWCEVVEVVDGDTAIPLFEGDGMAVPWTYNQAIAPFTDTDGRVRPDGDD